MLQEEVDDGFHFFGMPELQVNSICLNFCRGRGLQDIYSGLSQTQSLIIRLSISFTFLNILSLQINPVAPQAIAEAA